MVDLFYNRKVEVNAEGNDNENEDVENIEGVEGADNKEADENWKA